MTFLICMLGAEESYAGASEKLEAVLYYHAAEHLTDYCALLPAPLRAAWQRRWSTMLWHGEVLQMMIQELKQTLAKVTDTAEA